MRGGECKWTVFLNSLSTQESTLISRFITTDNDGKIDDIMVFVVHALELSRELLETRAYTPQSSQLLSPKSIHTETTEIIP